MCVSVQEGFIGAALVVKRDTGAMEQELAELDAQVLPRWLSPGS